MDTLCRTKLRQNMNMLDRFLCFKHFHLTFEISYLFKTDKGIPGFYTEIFVTGEHF